MRFRTQVTGALLAAGLIPLALLGYFGIERWKAEATRAAEELVTVAGQAKRDAVAGHLAEQMGWMEVLATAPEITRAIEAFAADALVVAEVGTIAPDLTALTAILSERHSRTKDSDAAAMDRWVRDLDPVALTLNQLFLVANPHPEGHRQDADNAPGGGRYSMTHRVHHPFLRGIHDRFGYHDIFLIEPAEARIVYSVMKEPDFGTSLRTGPYRDSAFAREAVAMIEAKGAGGTLLVDFSPYEPSFNAPAAFVLTPLGQGDSFRGVLAFQISLDFAEAIVNGDQADQDGERRAYVLAQDLGLRTIPPGSEGAGIGDRLDSPLIDSIATQIEGTRIARNERGTEVVAAVEPLDLPGAEWILVSEVARKTVLATALAAEQSAWRVMAVLAVVITLVGLVVARLLLRPVVRLGTRLKTEADGASTALDAATGRAGEAVRSVAAVAEETSAQSDMVRDSSQQAAANVQEVSSSVEELAASISDVAQGVRATSGLMRDASEKTAQAEAALTDLERVADRIRGMVDLINDVANRTNLLALNAAVEAAHAGEAGRGFAVVASEIRKLAGRTTESTDVIGGEVRLVLQSVQANGAAIREISAAVRQVSEMAASLAASADEQQRVTAAIAQRMSDTSARVNEVDGNIETMRLASGNAAQSAAALVGELRQVDAASTRIVAAITDMAGRIRRL